MTTQPKVTGVSITGLVFLVLGILLLLDNLHVIYFNIGDFIHDWWPSVLGLVGLYDRLRNNRSGGWFLVGLGTLLLLKINHLIDGHLIIALILILIGIGLLIRPRRPIFQPSSGTHSGADRIKLQAIFNESHENLTSENFQGGDIEVIFGKMTVDLRNIKMSPGRWRINLETIFGSTVFIVPGTVRTEALGSPIFGHISNQAKDIPKDDNIPILEIQTDVVFGSLDIHN